jgi:hypothetical protein
VHRLVQFDVYNIIITDLAILGNNRELYSSDVEYKCVI